MATKATRRANGTGRLVQKQNGFYAFQYVDAMGRRKTESLKTKSRREATRLADERAAVLTARNSVEAVQEIAKAKRLVQVDDLPLADVWEAFEDTHPKCSEGTLSLHRGAWNRFHAWMGEHYPNVTDLADVEKETAQKFLDSLVKAGLSASRYNDIRCSLNQITKAVAARRMGIENPWPTGRDAKRTDDQQHHKPFNAEHRAALMNVLGELKGDDANEMRCLFMLALYGGMRLKDAVMLREDSVHPDHIEYMPFKTRRTSKAVCRVPKLDPVRDALAVVESEDGYVLPLLAAEYDARPSTLKARITRLIDKAVGDVEPEKIEGSRVQQRKPYAFHGLRTTFAVECVKAGVHAGQLRAMLGDHSQTIDKFYAQARNLHDGPAEIGFNPLPRLLSGKSDHPERDRMKQLADELPLSEVRRLLEIVKATA